MTFLSLFAGIGGLDLGLERAGMRCVGQVEIDPFCQRVLAKHWPDVPRWDDVKTFTAGMLSEKPDLICGGFPCQDISFAGKHAGMDGERSGLWSEFRRIIRDLRPQFVLVENVAALLTRGIGRVLGEMAEDGFDAEWACVPAAAVGAPHIRDRVFIFAYRPGSEAGGAIAHYRSREAGARRQEETSPSGRCAMLCGGDHWNTEPGICRVADGISANVDRVAVLGNAVVPQVAEFIGRLIFDSGFASQPPSTTPAHPSAPRRSDSENAGGSPNGDLTAPVKFEKIVTSLGGLTDANDRSAKNLDEIPASAQPARDSGFDRREESPHA